MDVDEKLRKLKPCDKQADRMWLYYLASEGDERRELSEILDCLMHFGLNKDFEKKILLEPPDPNLLKGSYHLGDVIYPDKSYAPFGLQENEWIKHVLICGMSGVGKTNLAFHILREFKKHHKPFLVFDWKRNYRDLLQLPEFSKLRVYTVAGKSRPFCFNPLIPPPGSSPGQWLVRLIDVMKHAYFLGAGVEYLLREAIDSAYERNDVFEGSSNYPRFSDIHVLVYKRRCQGRMSLWQASALRALSSVTYDKGLGAVLNVSDRLNPSDLLEHDVVLELDALSDVDKVFFTEVLLLWIYEYRKNQGSREKFKHAIIIEEGHHVLSSWKERHEGQETIMETCLRQIREFGESVIVLDQEPSKLSDSIKANTYSKIVFNLGNGRDIEDIAACLQLDHTQQEYMSMLETGSAILSLSGRFFCPILLSIPFVPIRKGKVTDSMLFLK
jgi:DNA helicase HerA-like ATPase